jgi:hypothetical protein
MYEGLPCEGSKDKKMETGSTNKGRRRGLDMMIHEERTP